jgi:hypothetical protein
VAAQVVDKGAQFNAHPADLEDIFRRFLEVLTLLPAPKLLIALDHLDAVDSTDFREDVFPKLVEPIVLAPSVRVGLLLAGRSVSELLRHIQPGCAVRLTPFEPGEMPILVRQYLRYYDAWSPERAQLWTPVLKRRRSPLKPVEFENVRQWMENYSEDE